MPYEKIFLALACLAAEPICGFCSGKKALWRFCRAGNALAHYQYWQSKIAQAKASGVDSSSVLGLKAKSKTAEKALKKTQLKIDEALHFEASWRLNSWMWLFVGFEFVMLFFILRPVLWYEKYADDSIIVIPVFFPILLINRPF